MESDLALKLSQMLKDVEQREEKLSEKEKLASSALEKVQARETAALAREESIRAESAKLDEFRNVSEERQRTQNMIAKLRRDEETLSDARHNFATEKANEESIIHKCKVELNEAREKIYKQQQEINFQFEQLKREKIEHRDQVIRELKEIELKKLGV